MPAIKLSTRLQHLYQMANPEIERTWDRVWDLCCDHGHLGLICLAQGDAHQVHFVDSVPSIIETLSSELTKLPPEQAARGHLHTQDARKLDPSPGDRQLVVLAGVGGEKAIWILDALTQHPSFQHADWVISPTNSMFEVRQWLRQHAFGLVSESVVVERGWSYECLRASRQATSPVPAVGAFWDPDSPDHVRHLKRLRQHFQTIRDYADPERGDYALSVLKPVFDQL